MELRPFAAALVRTDGLKHACRMLEAEASKQLNRQVFWLTAQAALDNLPAGGSRKNAHSGFFCGPGALPITAAALQRICTVFPFHPCLPVEGREPVEINLTFVQLALPDGQ
jgi:hypothetical protein